VCVCLCVCVCVFVCVCLCVCVCVATFERNVVCYSARESVRAHVQVPEGSRQ
jgi:hypothetical protein